MGGLITAASSELARATAGLICDVGGCDGVTGRVGGASPSRQDGLVSID